MSLLILDRYVLHLHLAIWITIRWYYSPCFSERWTWKEYVVCHVLFNSLFRCCINLRISFVSIRLLHVWFIFFNQYWFVVCIDVIFQLDLLTNVRSTLSSERIIKRRADDMNTSLHTYSDNVSNLSTSNNGLYLLWLLINTIVYVLTRNERKYRSIECNGYKYWQRKAVISKQRTVNEPYAQWIGRCTYLCLLSRSNG
jgi:hypothetical protein